jgi:hypothetical protein
LWTLTFTWWHGDLIPERVDLGAIVGGIRRVLPELYIVVLSLQLDEWVERS